MCIHCGPSFSPTIRSLSSPAPGDGHAHTCRAAERADLGALRWRSARQFASSHSRAEVLMIESTSDPLQEANPSNVVIDLPAQSPSAGPPAGGPLWRNRDYVLLWGGQVISAIGSRVSLVAFPLLLLFLTGSPAQAGLVTALRGIPYALLMLPAGVLIDRWDRKRVMVLCDSARALALGSIPLAAALGR